MIEFKIQLERIMGKIEYLDLHISTPQKLVDVLNSFNSVKNQFDSSQNRFHDFMNTNVGIRWYTLYENQSRTHWGQNLYEVASRNLIPL